VVRASRDGSSARLKLNGEFYLMVWWQSRKIFREDIWELIYYWNGGKIRNGFSMGSNR